MAATDSPIQFLCSINPRAGKDESVLERVRHVFGKEADLRFLEEESDIYVVCDNSAATVEKLATIQAHPDVIDTQIEVLRTRHLLKKQVRVEHVYLVMVDLEAGGVDRFVSALTSEMDKLASSDVELLYVGEVFSTRADAVAIIATNRVGMGDLAARIRALPCVVDSSINTFLHTHDQPVS